MNVIISKTDIQHSISEAKAVLSNGSYKLKFSYGSSTEGVVTVVYPYSMQNFNALEYAAKIMSEKDNEKGVKENVGGIMLFTRARVNITSNGTDIAGKNEFNGPMTVKVFAYEKNGNDLYLYEQNNSENTAMIQYTVSCTKIIKRGFLGMGKPVAIVKVTAFDGVFSGLLYYTVSDSKMKYPISEKLIGQEFEIPLKKDVSVDIKVNDKYKDYFKCVCN